MTLTLPKLRPIHMLVALALLAFGAVLIAQIEGERGIAPIASSGDFEVRDIAVDIYGPDADTARQAGWKLAQRLAWKSLWKRTNGSDGPAFSDTVLDGLVSGIEVQQEQIGPNRYIATLAVLFDRARAGQALGVSGQIMRSPPLLVIPVITDGGVATTFEDDDGMAEGLGGVPHRRERHRLCPPAGDGPDALLLNANQISRRGRTWLARAARPIWRGGRDHAAGPARAQLAGRADHWPFRGPLWPPTTASSPRSTCARPDRTSCRR